MTLALTAPSIKRSNLLNKEKKPILVIQMLGIDTLVQLESSILFLNMGVSTVSVKYGAV
jgi:hypothetical protein